mgnify:CR=1 FL=1
MKFGALYSYWGHEWKCDYIETAKRMHACGCEVLEVGAPHLLDMTDEQLKELKDTVYSYGYEDILEYDLKNAKAKNQAGLQAVENYYKNKGEQTIGEN